MNTKMTLVLLTTMIASSASAQMTNILPGGRGNLYIGTPLNLPGPVPSIAPRINLPTPLLTPTIALTLAPVPMAAAIPVLAVAIPTALPLHSIVTMHENVAMPFPALRAQLAAPAKDDSAKDAAAAKRKQLDNLFDGSKREDESGPVRSGRHVSLPEQDLESEIGAY